MIEKKAKSKKQKVESKKYKIQNKHKILDNSIFSIYLTLVAFKYLSGDDEQIVKPPGLYQIILGSSLKSISISLPDKFINNKGS